MYNGTWEVKRPLENLVKHSAVASWFKCISCVSELCCPGNITHELCCPGNMTHPPPTYSFHLSLVYWSTLKITNDLSIFASYYAFVIVSLTWLAYFLSHDYLSYKFTCFFIYFLFLSDEGPMLETLDHTIRIGSTPTFLYFDSQQEVSDAPPMLQTFWRIFNCLVTINTVPDIVVLLNIDLVKLAICMVAWLNVSFHLCCYMPR